MLRSYICQQCRARLHPRNVSLRNPQWQPRATIISFAKVNEQTAPQETQETPQVEPTPEASPGVGRVKSKIRKVAQASATQTKWEARNPSFRAGRYSKYVHEAEGHEAEHLEQNQGVFPEQPGLQQAGKIIQRREQDTRTDSRPAAPQGPRITHVGALRSHTAIIQKHLEAGSLHQAWIAFEKEFTSKDSAAFSEPSFMDTKHMNHGSIFGLLLRRINVEFCKGAEVPRTPTEVLFHYEKIGTARHEYWHQTISKLTHELLFAISGTSGPQLNSDALLAELTSVWRLFFQCYGTNGAPLESIAAEWENFPDAETLGKPGLGVGGFKTGLFGPRLQTFHSKYVGNATLGFCAVTYFNLFDTVNQDVLQVSDSVREQSAPFLRLLTHILAGSVVEPVLKHTELSREFRTLPEDFQMALIDQIKSAPSEAMLTIGSGGNAVDPPSPEIRAAKQEEVFRRRINKLLLQQANSARMEQTWEEILQTYGPNNSRGNEPKVPESLYIALLTGFMALFQPQRSVEVWNHMVASGIKPNVRMWTAMLDGCSKARDLDGFNTLWTRFLKSGIEPDEYAWTVRVNTLIGTFGKVNDGLAALDEMGKRWANTENAIKNSPKKELPKKGKKALGRITVNPHTKPTIEVINAAITGFSRIPQRALSFQQRKDYTQKVLQWAGNFSLKPDRITYNSLISLYISGADYTTSFKLIAQMEKDGIPPDAYTYTMLINSAFENQKFTDLSETSQSERVISIFDELEAGGVQLNHVLYGSVIDRLLKQYENFEAVRAVITHMMARDLKPNPHIYTSLITQYFQQTPPNIAAVDSLWLQILATMGTFTDKYFFDRIIEGYAQNHEISKMMALLTRMTKEGKQPSWNALTAVVTALAQTGDWEKLHDIVRDVQKGEGVGHGVTGGRQHRLTFFHVVVDKLGIDLGDIGGGVAEQEPRLNVEGMEGGSDVASERTEDAQAGKWKLRDFGKGLAGNQKPDGIAGVDGAGEQKNPQELWNEQLNSLGVDDPEAEDLVPEEEKKEYSRQDDNGTVGGVPL